MRLVLRNARHPLLERTLKPKGVAVIPLTVELDSRASPAHHQRPQYRRKDRGAEDHRAAGADGAVGNAGAGRARRAAGFRRRLRRHRRLPVHRAEPLDFLRARHQHRLHLAPCDRASRWCCWTNWARPPIPKRARPWPLPSPTSFASARCLSIISTHHTALKVYAANTAGVLNAAVGFDERTLAPTYELRWACRARRRASTSRSGWD